jgi:protein-L-isoaspartate(D-aspartate) O-methyltransferase
MKYGDERVLPLQNALIEQIKQRGAIITQSVEEAFRAVPRHLFLPTVPLETVYQDTHVVTKTRDNAPLSSSSQPSLMANMLELLDIRQGQHILEIGAGTGYNAALLAHLVGETGQVTTVDIDEDIVKEARAHLRTAGYERVQVICGDGGMGYAPAAPYDRIILTTSASDIAPAWFEQLAPGGLLVMPLQLTSLKSRLTMDALVTFERKDNLLASRTVHASWFIPLRGTFAITSQEYALAPEPGLHLATRSLIDVSALYSSLLGANRDEPTGIRILQSETSGLYLWLALQEQRFCDIVAEGAWMTRQVVPVLIQLGLPTNSVATYGLCEGETLALLRWSHETISTLRPAVESAPSYDLYVRTFGAESALTQRLIELVQAWEDAGRPFVLTPDWQLERLHILAYPQSVTPPVSTGNSIVIEKQWTRLVCEW